MTAKTKTCTGCREVKDLSAFSVDRSLKSGRRGRCKACVLDASRLNPDVARRASQAYRERHPERAQAAVAKYRDKGPEVRGSKRERDAKRAAWAKAARFGTISMSAVRASRGDCYLCGQPLEGLRVVDHVVPLALGGSHGMANLAPVHKRCNTRKRHTLLADLDWYAGPALLGAWTVRPVGCCR